MRAWVFMLSSVWICAVIYFVSAQEPPMPKQPSVMTDTLIITNIIVTVTTTTYERRGVRFEGVFMPAKTNLLFQTRSNVYEITIPQNRP